MKFRLESRETHEGIGVVSRLSFVEVRDGEPLQPHPAMHYGSSNINLVIVGPEGQAYALKGEYELVMKLVPA